MKKTLNVLFAIFLVSNGIQAQTKNLSEIGGKWEVVGNKTASLTILDSATIELTYMGDKKTIQGYQIDFSKSPYWLDFSASDSNSTFHVKSLVQKVGDDVLKWQLFIDEERSPHFTSGKGEIMYLKKARPAAAPVASN
jgi:hypothetical protein